MSFNCLILIDNINNTEKVERNLQYYKNISDKFSKCFYITPNIEINLAKKKYDPVNIISIDLHSLRRKHYPHYTNHEESKFTEYLDITLMHHTAINILQNLQNLNKNLFVLHSTIDSKINTEMIDNILSYPDYLINDFLSSKIWVPCINIFKPFAINSICYTNFDTYKKLFIKNIDPTVFTQIGSYNSEICQYIAPFVNSSKLLYEYFYTYDDNSYTINNTKMVIEDPIYQQILIHYCQIIDKYFHIHLKYSKNSIISDKQINPKLSKNNIDFENKNHLNFITRYSNTSLKIYNKTVFNKLNEIIKNKIKNIKPFTRYIVITCRNFSFNNTSKQLDYYLQSSVISRINYILVITKDNANLEGIIRKYPSIIFLTVNSKKYRDTISDIRTNFENIHMKVKLSKLNHQEQIFSVSDEDEQIIFENNIEEISKYIFDIHAYQKAIKYIKQTGMPDSNENTYILKTCENITLNHNTLATIFNFKYTIDNKGGILHDKIWVPCCHVTKPFNIDQNHYTTFRNAEKLCQKKFDLSDFIDFGEGSLNIMSYTHIFEKESSLFTDFINEKKKFTDMHSYIDINNMFVINLLNEYYQMINKYFIIFIERSKHSIKEDESSKVTRTANLEDGEKEEKSMNTVIYNPKLKKYQGKNKSLDLFECNNIISFNDRWRKNLKLAYGNDTISSLIKQFEKKLKNEKMLQYIISRDNPQNSELCL